MTVMRPCLSVALAVLLCSTCRISTSRAEPSAPADSPTRSLFARALDIGDEGWGGSAVSNMGAFYFNGDYALFSAGVGFGISYKFHSARRKYLHELGVYVAPQAQGNGSISTSSVSALVHWNFIQAFGLGIGVRFWESGKGTVSPKRSRAYFTLGYGLTSAPKSSETKPANTGSAPDSTDGKPQRP